MRATRVEQIEAHSSAIVLSLRPSHTAAMLAFWPDVVCPLLEALAPESIVEVGSENGKTTRRLLELAESTGAVVHAIDPAPRFDVATWQQLHGERFVFHHRISLDALADIERFDAVLIDGDHNWYTVFHELQLIETRCRERQQPLPLIMLHDVTWPYGRRDLYYAPESIPERHRQPYARKGISPTSSELLDDGGFNAHLCNASHEGGPHNGVLTAVEDYLKDSSEAFDLVRIPAAFGLAILLPRPLAKRHPEVAAKVACWACPEVERFIDRLETTRIAMMTGLAGPR